MPAQPSQEMQSPGMVRWISAVINDPSDLLKRLTLHLSMRNVNGSRSGRYANPVVVYSTLMTWIGPEVFSPDRKGRSVNHPVAQQEIGGDGMHSDLWFGNPLVAGFEPRPPH
jgi:hypothetical protein